MSALGNGGRNRAAGAWFHAIEGEHTTRDPLIATAVDLKGVDEWRLRSGQVLTEWDESCSFRAASAEDDGDADDVLHTALVSVPVYSARLRSALVQGGIGGVQWLPVRVLHYDGAPVDGYAICNILGVVPALDLERSDFSTFGDEQPARRDEVAALRRPVLRREALAGYDIIRLREYSVYIVVSPRFRQVFGRGGFTGYGFSSVEVL